MTDKEIKIILGLVYDLCHDKESGKFISNHDVNRKVGVLMTAVRDIRRHELQREERLAQRIEVSSTEIPRSNILPLHTLHTLKRT